MPTFRAALRAGRLALLLLVVPFVAPPPAARAADCSLCHHALAGTYTVFEGLDWNVCANCMSAPKCAGCNLPRTGRLQGDGDHCSRCLADAEACTACGRALVERYWTIAGVDGRYCEGCRSDAPECSACKAPTRSPFFVDGRVMCYGCHGNRIEEPDDYALIYERIVARAAEVLGLTVDEMPELVISDERQIAAARGDQPARSDVCGLYCRDHDGGAKIHLLSHLPEARTTAILAHEYAHAWQAENCPEAQGIRLREGFAEWVAWRVLDGLPGMESEREIIAARDDTYGQGFRIFQDLERRHGTDQAIWYAKAARRE